MQENVNMALQKARVSKRIIYLNEHVCLEQKNLAFSVPEGLLREHYRIDGSKAQYLHSLKGVKRELGLILHLFFRKTFFRKIPIKHFP